MENILIKRALLSLFMISSTYVGNGQNLVLNGNFEQYSSCPDFEGQINHAIFWSNPAVFPGPGGSPDYFHKCALDPQYGIPNNFFGFQDAHSGEAYGGIVTWSINPQNWTEFIEVRLSSTLTAGQSYFLEMYISLANNCFYTSDDIGVYFSDTLISGITNYLPLPYIPQINFTLGLPTDTVNWILLSGLYIASGNENYITIGNYQGFNSSNLVINTNAPLDYAYFYVDDVSLTPYTNIMEQNLDNVAGVFPNPFNNRIDFTLKGNDLNDVCMYDVTGRKIIHQAFINSISINTEHLASGIYIYELRTINGPASYRVIKNGKIVKE